MGFLIDLAVSRFHTYARFCVERVGAGLGTPGDWRGRNVLNIRNARVFRVDDAFRTCISGEAKACSTLLRLIVIGETDNSFKRDFFP